MFGSARESADPNDIDLLAVYDRGLVGPEEAHRFRHVLSSALAELEIPVSVLLLTGQEHRSSRFAEMEKALLVWSRGPRI